MGKFKAAFMFVTPDSDPKTHRTSLSTPEVLDLVVVGVKDYDQAAQRSPGAGRPGRDSHRAVRRFRPDRSGQGGRSSGRQSLCGSGPV